MNEEIEGFYVNVFYYVSTQTNFNTYLNMSDETKAKFKMKMTILVCKAFAPRRNYDISRKEVFEMVGEILDVMEEQLDESTQS